MKKLTYEYVKNYFKEEGCELLETEYKNANTSMSYKCSCGNISNISWAMFQDGVRCNLCGNIKRAKSNRLDFEDVYNYFKDHGCELLETEYINNHTRMKYKCECGNISFVSFKDFKNGRRCRECGIKKRALKNKLTYQEVYDLFKQCGYELLETEYRASNINMKFKCDKGHIDYISYTSLKSGQRCQQCKINDITGQRFSRLVAIRETGLYNSQGKALWECQCDCGNTTYVSKEDLCRKKHPIQSCGCLIYGYYKVNGEWIKDTNIIITKKESTILKLYKTYQNGAKNRNLDFQLTLDQFKEMIFKNCYYCGQPPQSKRYKKIKKDDDFKYNGIDRINNEIGYFPDNCAPCCFTCNRIKLTMSIQDFTDKIKNIYENFVLKYISQTIQ